MPLSFTIDHDRRFVHVRADGDVGLKDVKAFLDALVIQNALPYRKLVDSRKGVARYISADIVQLTARMEIYAHINRRGPVAVVPNPEHRDIIEHFLGLGRPQRPGRCFLDYSEAEHWLLQQPEA
jgi:hypothetical protein